MKGKQNHKKRVANCNTLFINDQLVVKEQQGIPGDDVTAVLEFQTVFFQNGNDIDAVAFDAGVHPFREAAGFAV